MAESRPAAGCWWWGGSAVKSWSKRQATIALSSGEAEYVAIVKAVAEALGLQSLARDLGEDVPVFVLTDSAAARGIANRVGLGKIRHLDTRLLWLQELVRDGRVRVRRVRGDSNPADHLTKGKGWGDAVAQMRIVEVGECDGGCAGDA